MIIKNILVKQLFKVLNSLPKGTLKIDIEYNEDDEESKITIYPSDDESDGSSEDIAPTPKISPDEDITKIL